MKTHPTTKCWRYRRRAKDKPYKACGAPYSAHDPVTLACPDGYGSTFRVRSWGSSRASTSATRAEAAFLRDLVRLVLSGRLRGDDAVTYARQHARELGGWLSRANSMIAAVEAYEAGRPAEEKGEAAE